MQEAAIITITTIIFCTRFCFGVMQEAAIILIIIIIIIIIAINFCTRYFVLITNSFFIILPVLLQFNAKFFFWMLANDVLLTLEFS
jgi:hypothetical protein